MHTLTKGCSLSGLVVLCSMLPIVYSLKCFECTLSQEGCASTLTNVTITDCSRSLFTLRLNSSRLRENDDQFQCLKTVERHSNETYYTRRCAYKEESNICNKTNSVSGSSDVELVECSLCKEDYCNHSPTTLKLSSIYYYYSILCFMYLITG